MKCPLLARFGIHDEPDYTDPTSVRNEGAMMDWAKDICTIACPLQDCIYSKAKMSSRDLMICAMTQITLSIVMKRERSLNPSLALNTASSAFWR